MHTWVFNTCFLGRPAIADFWGLGGPGGPKNHYEGGVRSPPPSGMAFGAAGAVQTPKISDFPKNHVLKTQAYSKICLSSLTLGKTYGRIFEFSFGGSDGQSSGNGFGVGLPFFGSLIYAAFLKPGPFVTVPGPTLAEKRPNIEQTSNIDSIS